jgi:tRNA(Ile2) C34 agmatinyltransferase TiaS
MTLDHIRDALHIATTTDYKNSDFGIQVINQELFAKLIQYKVLDEVLAIARANTIVSDSALELYKDLQAYDRFERGFNF